MANTIKKAAKKKAKKKPQQPPRKAASTSKALAVVQEPQSNKQVALSLANPKDVMQFGKVLKSYIKENKLSVIIEGKDYAMVDGWKFAGMNFGLTAIPHDPVIMHESGQYITILYITRDMKTKDNKSYKKEVPVFVGQADARDIIADVRSRFQITRELIKPFYAYKCECDIVKIFDNGRVSRGTGLCSNLEILKSGFEEYSVNSMAQTRSIGKAYRNLLGYVMNAAGFEPTPAEEMDEVKRHNDDSYVTVVPESKKPFPSDKQFYGMLQRVTQGTSSLEEAEKHFTLTADQKEAMKVVEDARKK